ncbi:hypothetical protein KQY53_000595 [Listeria monocytogenes]|nr:3'-5' exonuclease [Listeria monocytogenes]EAC3455816.1 3'-5' exonuclease [Listeria monocytogenes]EAC4094733.1 3'-5' exonuclease [Listeria monocytogenes]EAC4364861.1 3'-5' exonuclease [Listeria monocytogenes]EAC4698855.1 3'-5' exonuclease [Listeria monocytogenes]
MKNFIILDIETQSFEVECGIYEVACLAIENCKVIDKLYLGISQDDYMGIRKYGFGFENISCNDEEILKFQSFLTKYPYPLVAHNCPFDKKFIEYYNWLPSERDWYCSMRAIRKEVSGLKSYSLGKLITHYNLGRGAKHTAFEDVESVLALLQITKPKNWYKVGQKSRSNRKKFLTDDEKNKLRNNNDIKGSLFGEIICFTGTCSYTRKEMQSLAVLNGAEISNNITKTTSMLVVGENAGSKLDKAQENDLNIISDDEFMQKLDNALLI